MLISSTGLMSAFEAFRIPAGSSVMPLLIPKEKYTTAVSLKSSTGITADLIGKGIAGTIIAVGGPGLALAVDAATFFISASVLATLKMNEQTESGLGRALKEFGSTFKSGLSYLFKTKVLLAICGVMCLINFVQTPLMALQTAYVSESLKLSAQGLSLMGAAMSAGILAGSVIYPRLVSFANRFKLLLAGFLGGAFSYIAFAALTFVQADWVKLALLAAVAGIYGVTIPLVGTSVGVSFMEKLDKDQVARMSGISNSLAMASLPLASFIVAAVSEYAPVTLIILITGIITIPIALSFLLIKPLREID
jgi:Na+/melibiose symporter-like transporter